MDNYENFVAATGTAFTESSVKTVLTRELHTIHHHGDVMEDTLHLGETTLTNRTVANGKACEIVSPNGVTQIVTARWDGDVWVEVDECLVMETRRWMEGQTLIMARTVTRPDGTLCTVKSYFGPPRKKVKGGNSSSATPAMLAAASSSVSHSTMGEGKKTPSALLAANDDAQSERSDGKASVIDHVMGMFSGGGNTNTNKASPLSVRLTKPASSLRDDAPAAEAALFFGLEPNAHLCGRFECSLGGYPHTSTPTSPRSPRVSSDASKGGAPGVLYVFKYALGFAGKSPAHTKWFTQAPRVTALEMEGTGSITVQLVDGSLVWFNAVTLRDASFDVIIAMLEEMPPASATAESPRKSISGGGGGGAKEEMDVRPNGPPLRVGYHADRSIVVHVVDALVPPHHTAAGSMKSGFTAGSRHADAELHLSLGRFVAVLRPLPDGSIDRVVVFPAAEVNAASDAVVLSLRHASGGNGNGHAAGVLGEARLPLASLPSDAKGVQTLLESPLTVAMYPPGFGLAAEASGGPGSQHESAVPSDVSRRKMLAGAGVKVRQRRDLTRLLTSHQHRRVT